MEEEMHNRLKIARVQAGFKSGSAAAEALGVPAASYLAHENGSRGITLPAAKKYARRFRVELNWLLTSTGPMKSAGHRNEEGAGPVRIPIEEWDPAQPDVISGEDERAYSNGTQYEPTLPGARPEIDVRPGAGEGSVGENVIAFSSGGAMTGHRVIDEWVFPERYFRHELHASTKSVIFQAIIGDSMYPTLASGDRIIVDTAQNTFGPDGIYVFDDGDGEPRVKRLSKVLFSNPEQVQIISDNQLHAPQTVELSRVRIIGRVVGRVSKM